MAIDRSFLQKFLDNPASVSAEDFGLDNGESLAPDESSDGAMEVPELDPEAELLSPEIGDSDEVNQEMDLAKDESDSMSKESSETKNEEIASDMKAPMELRKKALLKIKQKYLGQ